MTKEEYAKLNVGDYVRVATMEELEEMDALYGCGSRERKIVERDYAGQVLQVTETDGGIFGGKARFKDRDFAFSPGLLHRALANFITDEVIR